MLRSFLAHHPVLLAGSRLSRDSSALGKRRRNPAVFFPNPLLRSPPPFILPPPVPRTHTKISRRFQRQAKLDAAQNRKSQREGKEKKSRKTFAAQSRLTFCWPRRWGELWSALWYLNSARRKRACAGTLSTKRSGQPAWDGSAPARTLLRGQMPGWGFRPRGAPHV